MDFVSDHLQDGTRFRSLTIVDVFTREAVAIDARQSRKGENVVGMPNRLKSSREVDLGVYRNGVKIDFSRSGTQTDKCVRQKLQRELPIGVPENSWVHESEGG